jgi:hypothetical protein
MGKQPQQDQRELPKLLRMISFLVVCLYRMPIRQFAVTEKIKTRISEQASFYRHFDVLFVRDLFPNMDETAATNLGRSISQRRSILFYNDARDEQLEALDSGDSNSESPTPAPAPAPNEIITVDETALHEILGQELALSEGKSVPFTLPSKATTFIQKPSQQSWLYPPPPSVATSEKSAVSDYAAQELVIAVPKMPVASSSTTNDTFVCPYCRSPQRVTSEILWRKHVFDDLQPYVCTFPSCDLQEHLFTDRKQWWKHETEVHRFAWHCNTRHHQSYDDQERFLRHMQEAHSTSFTSIQLYELTSVFRSPSEKAAGVCNLCFRHSENLKSHVSRHLQRIALFALPRPKGVSDVTSGNVQGEKLSQNLTDIDAYDVKTEMSLSIDSKLEMIAADTALTHEENVWENDVAQNSRGESGITPHDEPSNLPLSQLSYVAEQDLQPSSGDIVLSWLQSEGASNSSVASMCQTANQ